MNINECVLLKPSEWSVLENVEVIDRDGWEVGTWETPITRTQFYENLNTSTIRPLCRTLS
jgi:hypothetical protein